MYTRGFAGLAGDQAPSFSFTKTSGPTPYPAFQVGDSWVITVTGPANAPIFVATTQNGIATPANLFGTTDANGNFSFIGTMLQSAIGNWSESWYIGTSGGGPADTTRNLLSTTTFSVSAPAAASASPSSPQPVASAPSDYSTPAQVNQVLAASGLQIAGYDIPWWAVGGVGIGLLYLLSGGRHR